MRPYSKSKQDLAPIHSLVDIAESKVCHSNAAATHLGLMWLGKGCTNDNNNSHLWCRGWWQWRTARLWSGCTSCGAPSSAGHSVWTTGRRSPLPQRLPPTTSCCHPCQARTPPSPPISPADAGAHELQQAVQAGPAFMQAFYRPGAMQAKSNIERRINCCSGTHFLSLPHSA